MVAPFLSVIFGFDLSVGATNPNPNLDPNHLHRTKESNSVTTLSRQVLSKSLLPLPTTAPPTTTHLPHNKSSNNNEETRAATSPPHPQVVDLGEWVPWEFQSEDQESPSNSESCDEVVPNPPPCEAGAALSGMKGGGLNGIPGMMPGATIAGKEGGPEERLRRCGIRRAGRSFTIPWKLLHATAGLVHGVSVANVFLARGVCFAGKISNPAKTSIMSFLIWKGRVVMQSDPWHYP